MKLVLLVLVLAVSLSLADQPTTISDIYGGGSGQGFGSEAETIYWSQLPTGYAMASQYITDYAWDSSIADDFEFAVSTTVNKIRYWGGYWNGNPGPHDSPVEIYLYLDDGTGNAPTLPEHTSAIASWMIAPGQYTEIPDGADYLVTYEFPTWVVFDAGQKYWIECRKAFPFAPLGQYGWIQAEPVSLSPCVQGFPDLGIVYWTAQTTDAAFELVFDDAIALERATWADIKTIF